MINLPAWPDDEMNGKIKGYLLGVVAAASYGTNPLFALPLYEKGMNADSVLFFRYLLAIPVLGIMLWGRGHNFRLSRNQILPMLCMGVLISLSSLSLFMSYNFMAASIASTMLFVYPIMVALIMALVFREKLSWLTVVCLLLACGGIAMLFDGGSGATLSLAGTILVMASALTYAIYIVGINKTSLDKVATLKVSFYVLAVGIWLFVVRFFCGVPLTIPAASDWPLWGNILALAVLPTAVSFLCTTAAIQRIGPTPTAILGAFEPVTAIFFGLVVFGERLGLRQWIGVVMIIVAVILVVGGGQITHALLRKRKLFPRKYRKP